MGKYGWHGDVDERGFDPDIASHEARFKGRVKTSNDECHICKKPLPEDLRKLTLVYPLQDVPDPGPVGPVRVHSDCLKWE